MNEFRHSKTLMANFQRVTKRHFHSRAEVGATIQPVVMTACQSCGRCRVAWQQLEKSREALGVKSEIGWKLPKNRPQLVPQLENSRCKEISQRSLAVIQLLHMRDEPRTLHCKHKIAGRGRSPRRKAFWSLQRIKCPVD